MNSKSFSALVLLATLTPTLPAWADTTIPDDLGGKVSNGVLQENAELTDCGSLSVASDLDLNGFTLTLTGVTAMSGTASITDSDGKGVLDMEVTGDFTQTAYFKGKMRLVKRGTKKLTLIKEPQSPVFSGGIEIVKGTLTAAKYGNAYLSFGNPPNITVRSGATMLPNACYGFTPDHTITLDGGSLGAGRADNNLANNFHPTISLSNDSTYNPGNAMLIGSALHLGEHTLTVAPTAACGWRPSAIANGTISVTKGTLTLKDNVGVTAGEKPTAHLSLASGVAVVGGYTYSVSNFTCQTTSDKISCVIDVYGIYTPIAVDAYAPRMMSGSTLNLGGLSAPYEAGAFEEGASSETETSVKVLWGSRAITKGETIMTWTGAAPANVKFTLEGDNVDPEKKLTVSDAGLVYDADEESKEVATAVWTGAVDGNVTNAANWTCQNAAGTEITGIPSTNTVVTFANELGKVDLTNGCGFVAASVILDNCSMTQDLDWSGLELEQISSSSSIDLKGFDLTLVATNATLTTTATFTDTSSDEPGTLNVVVPAGVTTTFGTPFLEGNLSLVKKGVGTLVISNGSRAFSGVTEIAEGVLKCADKVNINNPDQNSPFGTSKKVVVQEDGILDPAGSYAWGYHTIELNGGAISNTVGEGSSAASRNFNPTVTLGANSSFKTSLNYNFKGNLVSNGHALDVEIENGKYMTWGPASTDAALVRVTRGGWFRTLTNDCDVRSMSLEMSGAALSLSTALSVSNYVSSYGWTANDGAAELRVYGKFTPASVYFRGCVMQDGSTIDLSGTNSTWSSKSLSDGANTVAFADGAIITIDVGERTEGVAIGDYLVSWPAGTAYGGRVFMLAGGSATEGKALVADESGVKVIKADDSVFTARWNGQGRTGDFSDPTNWVCKTIAGVKVVDGVPDEGSIVTIPASFLSTLDCTKDSGLKFAALVVETDGTPVVLEGDRDWRGFGELDFTFPIDLAGNDLHITLAGSSSTDAVVTNSDAEVGSVLYATVLEGRSYDNTSVAFAGKMDLVKEGEGVFVATKYPQSYDGLTVVEEGVLRCANGMNMDAESQKSPFGIQRTIKLMPNGILDPAGSRLWGFHTVNGHGGIISNTVDNAGLTSGNVNATLDENKQFNPVLNLYSDLTFKTVRDFNFRATLNSNGHALNLQISSGKALVWYPAMASNAVVRVSGGGAFKTNQKQEVGYSREPGMTLVMIGASFDLCTYNANAGHLNVSNYIASCTNKTNTGDAELRVRGTFTPAAVDADGNEYFRGCKMMNGSTIDLCGKTGVWSLKSSMNGKNTVTFADNATVTIDVHTRINQLSVKTPIVSWTQETAPAAANLTFEIDNQSKAAGYRIVSKADGLYPVRKGLVFIIQ